MATKKYITKRLDTMAAKASGSKTKIEAINKCRRWLDQLHWADMREPIFEEINRLCILIEFLTKKEKSTPLSQEEDDTCGRYYDSLQIYRAFYTMIFPTAWNAELERKNRQKSA